MLELALKTMLAYLLGSVNGALVIGRLYGGVDIRSQGSGNAGGTNALRTQGKVFALLTVLIDVGKGFLPVWILPGLNLPGIGTSPGLDLGWGPALYGAAAVAGHCYPIWHGFKGGKGAATMLGVYLAYAPILLLPILLTWGAMFLLSGYVGLATMASGFAAPVYLLLSGGRTSQAPLLSFAFACALFIVFTHRSNIKRMIDGSESRMRKGLLARREK
jgi:glycerol-3-phosphate acyltransferase PlsY